MAKWRVLVQWIGHSDLRGLADSLSPSRAKKILDRIKPDPASEGSVGPTKTLLTAQKFDAIRLLSNYDSEWNGWFRSWVGQSAEIIEVELAKPTDYAQIFEITDRELAALKGRKEWAETELCLHLSPGTPAMTAVLLLLGKTRYPATFYETSRDGKSWVTNVPFDLIDVIPDVLKNPDVHLQYLASESPSEVEGFQDIVGDSRTVREAVGRAKRAAMRGVSVLLLGESGTGKEMFAQAIHRASPRRERPFLAINCAALPKTLLESELFGHVKGAFTGAEKNRDGAFVAADRGTLFLDEVGECDLEIQAKLLRVLQPITGAGPGIRKVSQIGNEKEQTVDVRIIAATNRDLYAAIKDGKFRDDLFFRLAAVTITLPPLRDRKSDIPKISEHLMGLLNRQFEAEEPDYKHKQLSASAIAFVKKHPWPGNVRQLYNALVQAAVLTDGDRIGKREIAAAAGEMSGLDIHQTSAWDRPLGDGFDLEEHLNALHKHYLRRAMEESGGVKAQAARLLGMKHYQTLDAQLERLEVKGDWKTEK